jgi:hypothetical protein
MKRIVTSVLGVLGFALLTAAVGVNLFLVPQLRVVPLDLDIVSDATTVSPDDQAGNRFPATLFDRCSIQGKKARTFDAHLTQQRRSRIVEPSNRRQATLQSAQTVRIDRIREADGKEVEPTMAKAGEPRKCTDALLTASIDRVSVNRKTAVPNGAVSSIQTEAAPPGTDPRTVSVEVKRQGFQYKFGFNVQKHDYLYFDLNTRQDTRARFVDEKKIDGLTVYHFVTEVPETDLADLETPQGEAALGTMVSMPAHWWGITGRGVKPGETLTMHRYAKATRHVWVEPKTGTIVDGREDQSQYFRFPDRSDNTPQAVRDFELTSLKATFQWEPTTVKAQAERAQEYVSKLRFGQTVLPLILGIAGLLSLLASAALLFFGRRSPDNEPTALAPSLIPESVTAAGAGPLGAATAAPDLATPATASPWSSDAPWQRVEYEATEVVYPEGYTVEQGYSTDQGYSTAQGYAEQGYPVEPAVTPHVASDAPRVWVPDAEQPPAGPSAEETTRWRYDESGRYVIDTGEDPDQPLR